MAWSCRHCRHMTKIVIRPINTKRDLKAFIELAYRLYADDPHWVPPFRSDMRELLTPGKNPFFEHADVQLMLAEQNGHVVGRISAHIDHLALTQPAEQGMGPGTGNWGLMEAESAEVAQALMAAAEGWLRSKGMHRVLAPLSMSVWEEPGLLTKGHEHPPTIMMGHHKPEYQPWIEGAGYQLAKQLFTYEVLVCNGFPDLVNRIVASGERNPRINVRNVDKSHFDRDAAIILGILNDAWSDNWGFVPFTESEIAYIGKKLKPLVYEPLIQIAELDGEPVAFMMTLPDMNEITKSMKGSLFPFNWAKLLWWLRAPKARTMRVPLMGVLKQYQSSRLASQLAFMMIEKIRRSAVADFGTKRGEIGWILEDNKGMVAIAQSIESHVNKVYSLYDKRL